MDDKNKTIVSFYMYANTFTIFTKEMARSMVGQETKFRDLNNNLHPAKIVEAKVNDEGTAVILVLEVDDPEKIIRKMIQSGNDMRTSFDIKEIQ